MACQAVSSVSGIITSGRTNPDPGLGPSQHDTENKGRQYIV